ncbi:hypothetical protein BO94DRAFT_245763 [Aspergillus sclerotioniger CBS 115572]|uniref:Uncharacterized protein n=1 Tax=Aspergillus sclerotioniger CBS 115572 TaxID=1450535 RepID=A0A317VHY2_9EURO|nr:hypothetical protein BO94DRAFT_245763 [Aspergillus sclerotioniger CBS 115572]PWY72492.1 hypothetical protein BO94DRAFT_245763 [Aspergillus sclerotioniger CBS 115572]
METQLCDGSSYLFLHQHKIPKNEGTAFSVRLINIRARPRWVRGCGRGWNGTTRWTSRCNPELNSRFWSNSNRGPVIERLDWPMARWEGLFLVKSTERWSCISQKATGSPVSSLTDIAPFYWPAIAFEDLLWGSKMVRGPTLVCSPCIKDHEPMSTHEAAGGHSPESIALGVHCSSILYSAGELYGQRGSWPQGTSAWRRPPGFEGTSPSSSQPGYTEGNGRGVTNEGPVPK